MTYEIRFYTLHDCLIDRSVDLIIEFASFDTIILYHIMTVKIKY